MGWDQVGALGTLGCLLVAIVTLVFVIKPLPWNKTDESVAARGVSKKLIGFLVAVIALAFILSGASIWAAWHPSVGVVHFPNNDEAHLRYIHGKHYFREEVKIDGIHFDDCTFKDVTLTYDGTDIGAFSNSTFENLQLKTNSDAISTAVSLYALLGFFKPGVPVLDKDGKPIKPIPGAELIH